MERDNSRGGAAIRGLASPLYKESTDEEHESMDDALITFDQDQGWHGKKV